jgi:hypothetical protein
VCPTVFYGGDGEELAFFVEDARETGRVVGLHWVPVQDAILREFAFDLDTRKVEQEVVQRNDLVRQAFSSRDCVFDAEVP